MTDTIQLSYRLERADFAALLKVLGRRRAVVSFLVAMAAGAIFAVPVVILSRASRTAGTLLGQPTTYFLAGMLALAAIVIGAIWLQRTHHWRGLLAANKDIAVAISSAGIVADLPNVRQEFAWPAIVRIVETPRHLFLLMSRSEGMVIPHRAVPDEATWIALVALVRQHGPRAGTVRKS